MSNWTMTAASQLTDGWEEALTTLCRKRADRTDTEWFDLDSGCSIVLVCDGGCRDGADAKYRLFHRAPTGAITEITATLGTIDTHFNREARGVDSYREVQGRLQGIVNRMLEARIPWRGASQ